MRKTSEHPATTGKLESERPTTRREFVHQYVHYPE
jgi:hypothetical protein